MKSKKQKKRAGEETSRLFKIESLRGSAKQSDLRRSKSASVSTMNLKNGQRPKDSQQPKDSQRLKNSQRLSVMVEPPVSAGFPSPAEDYLDCPLDLNELIISKPSATFFVRARGESMLGAGIQNGDLLVVDRSLETMNNDIVIAVLDGEFTVKRFVKKMGEIFLVAANPSYEAIKISPEKEFEIWGVVSYVIHKTR